MNEPENERPIDRESMVADQLRRRGIRDERILTAMAELPREAFMPAQRRNAAYEDSPQSIGHGQTISQPYVVALMTQELDVHPPHRVLEIGVGSGYQTAILAALAGHVYGVERLEPLAEQATGILRVLGIENVSVHIGDGTLGWRTHAPYDRILCAAGGPEVPESWSEQLTNGGRIVAPVGGRNTQELIRLDKRGDRLIRTPICGVRFVPLIGKQGWR